MEAVKEFPGRPSSSSSASESVPLILESPDDRRSQLKGCCCTCSSSGSGGRTMETSKLSLRSGTRKYTSEHRQKGERGMEKRANQLSHRGSRGTKDNSHTRPPKGPRVVISLKTGIAMIQV